MNIINFLIYKEISFIYKLNFLLDYNDYNNILYNYEIIEYFYIKFIKKKIINFYILNKFIIKYPYSKYKPNIIYLLAKLNFKNKNFIFSKYFFSILIKNYPFYKRYKSLVMIGDLLFLNKEYKKSLLIYKQICKIYPNDLNSKFIQKKINIINNKLKRDAGED